MSNQPPQGDRAAALKSRFSAPASSGPKAEVLAPAPMPTTTVATAPTEQATRRPPRRRASLGYDELHKRATWILPSYLPALVKKAAAKGGESQAGFVTRALREAIRVSGLDVPDDELEH